MQARIQKEIMEKYYLQPFDGSEKKDLYALPVERIGHGAQHASRVASYIIILVNMLREIGHPIALKLSDQDILYLQIAALFHDSGRKSDKSADIWEGESQKHCYDFLINEGVTPEVALEFAHVINQKENPSSNPWSDLLRQLLQAADCLDIMRCERVFHIDEMKLYEVFSQYNQQVKLIDLTKEILKFIAEQNDLKHDCRIWLTDDKHFVHDIAEHAKTRREDRPELKHAYECASDCYEKIVSEFKNYPLLNSYYHDDPLINYANHTENLSQIANFNSDSAMSNTEKEQQVSRNKLRLAAKEVVIDHDFLVKSLRADDLNYFLQFMQGVTPPYTHFKLRQASKGDWTVTGKGIFERATKLPQYPADVKHDFSKAQSASYGTPNFHPNIFGFINHKAKLAGVMLHIKDALLTDRNYVVDVGSINRPYDKYFYEDALDYFNQMAKKFLFPSDQIEEFKKEILKNIQGYNEVLARLHWNTDGTSCIFINSDTLEARLLAKTYANLLKDYLKFLGLCDEAYQIPIFYYMPLSALHLKPYTDAEQKLDQTDVERIIADEQLLQNKVMHDDFEFMFMLSKDQIKDVLNKKIKDKTVLQHIIESTYFHVIEYLIKLNKLDIEWLTPYLQLDGTSLLHSLASRDNNLELTKLMLKTPGIDINQADKDGETIFNKALKGKNREVLKMLLNVLGIDINKINNNGDTLSHFPWIFEDPAIAQLLHCTNIDDKSVNKFEETPLYLAAQFGFGPTLKKLLRQPTIDVNVANKDGWTPLHIASLCGRKNMTKILLKVPSINVNCTTDAGGTPLMMAISMIQIDIVKQLLAANADPNLANKDGFTALHDAVGMGNIDIVKALLDAKADPNLANQEGNTPLHYAVREDKLEIAKELLAAGANPNMANKEGNAALYTAVFQQNIDTVKVLVGAGANPNLSNNDNVSPLLCAVVDGNVEIVKELLKSSQIDPNKADASGPTPLCAAIAKRNVDIVDLLLEAHVDPNLSFSNCSPLYYAVVHGDLQVVKKLLAAKADPNKGRDDKTPLNEAIANGNTDIVKELLAANADPNLGDNAGIRPIVIAVFEGQIEIVKLLLAYKANFNLLCYPSIDVLREAGKKSHTEEAVAAMINKKNPDSSLTRIPLTLIEIATILRHQDIADLLNQQKEKNIPNPNRFFANNATFQAIQEEIKQTDKASLKI